MESAPKVMRIAEALKVFVLEDSPERIAWFRQRIPQAVVASNVEQALALLDEQTFDVCFLEHDLSFSDVALPDTRPGSGQRVAHYLAQERFSGIVVIHSVNEAGARAMKSHLPQSHVMPFGTFELENGGSSNPLLNTKSELRRGQKGLAATMYASSIAQPGRPNEDAFFVGRLVDAPHAAVFDGQGNAEGAAKMKECRWLKPVLVGQFEFVEWTADLHLRHTSFIAFRDDKKAKDVKREKP